MNLRTCSICSEYMCANCGKRTDSIKDTKYDTFGKKKGAKQICINCANPNGQFSNKPYSECRECRSKS